MSDTYCCDYCGEECDRDSACSVDNYRYCERCTERHAFWCDSCDGYHEDGHDDCSQDGVYYSEPNRFKYLHEPEEAPHKGLYLGTELEMEVEEGDSRYDLSRRLNRPWNFTKDDGSLNYGIELVTHPFTPLWLSKHETEFKDVLRVAQLGARARSSCGMHVHMSRSAMSKLHIYKILKLVYENASFFRTISGRTSFNYCETRPETRLARKAKGMELRRYQAVNLCPPDTIEVRLFAGTLKWERVAANLQLCHALWAYTKEQAIKDVQLPNFREFLQGASFKYAHNLVHHYFPATA